MQRWVYLFAANEGFLEDIELNKVLDFESALLAYMNSEHGDLLGKINVKAATTMMTQKKLLEPRLKNLSQLSNLVSRVYFFMKIR